MAKRSLINRDRVEDFEGTSVIPDEWDGLSDLVNKWEAEGRSDLAQLAQNYMEKVWLEKNTKVQSGAFYDGKSKERFEDRKAAMAIRIEKAEANGDHDTAEKLRLKLLGLREGKSRYQTNKLLTFLEQVFKILKDVAYGNRRLKNSVRGMNTIDDLIQEAMLKVLTEEPMTRHDQLITTDRYEHELRKLLLIKLESSSGKLSTIEEKEMLRQVAFVEGVDELPPGKQKAFMREYQKLRKAEKEWKKSGRKLLYNKRTYRPPS